MANPTVDKLAAVPADGPSWQTDASSNDNNLPQLADLMTPGGENDLSAELRKIKSEVRALSVNSGWLNYSGLESAPSPNAPAKVSATVFTLVGDWVTPKITQVGRNVRATFSDGTTAIATIRDANVAGSITTVTLNAGILAGVLKYVEFAAVGGTTSAAAGGYPLQLQLDNPTGRFVVPVSHGGTGQTDMNFAGDLGGSFPNATVKKLQGTAVSAVAPSETLLDQVLAWTPGAPGQWSSIALQQLLSLSQLVIDKNGASAKGTFVIPHSGTIVDALKVKWAISEPSTLPMSTTEDSIVDWITWDAGFDSHIFATVLTASNPKVIVAWPDLVMLPPARKLTGLDLDYYRVDNAATDIDDFLLTALALGI